MAVDLRRLGRALSRQASTAIERLTVSLEPVRQFRAESAESFKKPPTGELVDLPLTVWSEWTIARIRNANQALILGNFGPAALLAEAMGADDRIKAAINGRLKGTTKCDAVFTPSESDTSGEVAKTCEDLFQEILPLDVEEQILKWSAYLSFNLSEKIWESKTYKGRQLWVPRLKPWHPYYIYFDQGVRKFVAITMGGLQFVEPTGDPKWFLFTPTGYYRGWLDGAVRSVAIPWVVRQYALRDWGRFSEKHGLPMVVAKVPAQAPAEDKARFFTSIKNLGADTGLQLPVQAGKDAASWDVQLLEARDTSWKAFPGLIQTCDQSITLAIRGTNLTTQVDGGSYAASQTHREEDSDLSISDRKKLATALRSQLIREFVLYNFGSADLVPKLEFVSPESDPAAEAKVMLDVANALKILKESQVPVDVETVAQQFGIPLHELPPEQAKKDQPVIPLTPSDSAAIVTVDEARGTMKLGPWPVPEDGALSLEQFRNKPAQGASAEVPPGSDHSEGTASKSRPDSDGSGAPSPGVAQDPVVDV